VYLVVEDFGPRLGRAWCETDEKETDRATLISDLLAGQYSDPVRIIAFNTAEGCSRDVTLDIADELRRRYVATKTCPVRCCNSWTPIAIDKSPIRSVGTERREDFTLRV
jgi:hypothetical protein